MGLLSKKFTIEEAFGSEAVDCQRLAEIFLPDEELVRFLEFVQNVFLEHIDWEGFPHRSI